MDVEHKFKGFDRPFQKQPTFSILSSSTHSSNWLKFRKSITTYLCPSVHLAQKKTYNITT